MAEGRVAQVIGTVIDIEFPPDELPGLYNAVKIDMPDGTQLTAEVEQHIGNNWVRCLAMGATEGMPRGARAVDTGQAIAVPVGAGSLGRLFNVLGEALDGKGPVQTDVYWPIHRAAPTFDQQNTSAQMLETGIKVIDLVCPFARGGKIGCYGGACV